MSWYWIVGVAFIWVFCREGVWEFVVWLHQRPSRQRLNQWEPNLLTVPEVDHHALSLGKPELMDTPTLIFWLDQQLGPRYHTVKGRDGRRHDVQMSEACRGLGF